MRILFVLCLCLFSTVSGTAQSTWELYSDNLGGFNFELPSGGNTYDSLHTRMYTASVDSLLGLQVHLFDSAYFSEENELFTLALEQEGDTLHAITAIMLMATNSELIEIEDVDINGRYGLDVGLKYLSLASDIPTLTFCRYFLYDGKFVAFSISGSEDDLTRLLNYKATFFDSIQF